jgi:hypothetical protein
LFRLKYLDAGAVIEEVLAVCAPPGIELRRLMSDTVEINFISCRIKLDVYTQCPYHSI